MNVLIPLNYLTHTDHRIDGDKLVIGAWVLRIIRVTTTFYECKQEGSAYAH